MNTQGLVTLFAGMGFTVMPFWLLMIAAPRWRWTIRLAGSPLIALGPVALYVALVLPRLATLAPALVHPNLPAIAALLGRPDGALIAWVHFLALDLLAGCAIFRDARARGISPWLVSPVLILTMLFAPLGLAVYGTVRVARSPRLSAPFARLAALHRPLALLTIGSLALLAGSVVMLLADGHQVLGAPAWMKPAKFALSVGLAAPVLAWIIAQLPGRRVRTGGTIMAFVVALELVIISVQAARGVPSHFNQSSALDGVLFSIMGVGITVFWLIELWIAVVAFRHAFASPARTWAIRLGLVGTLTGGAVGYLMTAPTSIQRAQMRAGERPALIGGHAVGVPDGGPGLPVTGWSSQGGDLRVPHFFGLHALQVLPLIGVLLERRRRRGARPVVALGVAWLGLTLVALSHALRGQPLTAPDPATLTATLAVVVAALGALLLPSRSAHGGARKLVLGISHGQDR